MHSEFAECRLFLGLYNPWDSCRRERTWRWQLASHGPSTAVLTLYEEYSLNKVPVGLIGGSPQCQPNSQLTVP